MAPNFYKDSLMHKATVLLMSLPVFALPVTALALQTPEDLEAHAYGQHRADGVALRGEPNIGWQAPASARAAWQTFTQDHATWRAQWDLDLGIPSRIYGAGVDAAGASLSPDAAEASARAFFVKNQDLLLPGVSAADLVIVANDFDAQSQLRTVAFEQTVNGMTVRGAGVNVRIKNDRLFVAGSRTYGNIEAQRPRRSISIDRAYEAASKYIGREFNADVSKESYNPEPFVWAYVTADGRIGHDVVVEAIVRTQKPIGKWSVMLDANTAEPVGFEQLLKFAAGTVQLNAPDRYPSNGRIQVPAAEMNITVNGATAQTDVQGGFTFATAPAQVTGTVRGAEVVVDNDRGARLTFDTSVDDGATFLLDHESEEFNDAQVNTFHASTLVKAYTKVVAPDMRWLQVSPVQATVNINDTCNAFSDGTTINFFSAGNRCDNTGRLADVVYHEFGHSFHAHAVIRGVGDFDGALSEGASDYLAATMTNDPAMGRGFFYQAQPLRHINPSNSEAIWPDDVSQSTHETGLIFGGTMWDLRELMIASNSDRAAAVARTDFLWYQALRRAQDIPTTYVEMLAADDDDGDISNGTPNICVIQEAFAAHGLADPSQVGAPIGLPTLTTLTVSLPVGEAPSACPGASVLGADLIWQERENPGVSGVVNMAEIAEGYEAALPTPAAGTVLQYQVRVNTDDGGTRLLPDNPADPMYEVFVGEVTELFCTDFERDPDQDGFTHELLGGEVRDGADDWQWGAPAGAPGSGDPDMAYSGINVYGNDLGEGNFNGTYQPEKTNVLHAPSVAVGDFTNVRLHYRRWLNVEDGDFDQGRIVSNGQFVWTNLATGGNGDTHHEDKEWRFQDVDLSSTVQNGEVQVDFLLQTDRGLQFGGWTIDDFCIVGVPEVAAAECGNGTLEAGETCDDGNLVDGDGCDANCTPTPAACGDGRIDPGEACDDGNFADGDGCEANCTLTPDVDPCLQDPASCMEQPMQPEQPQNPNLPGNLNEGDGGCGCSAAETSGSSSSVLGLALLFGGLVLRRRRR